MGKGVFKYNTILDESIDFKKRICVSVPPPRAITCGSLSVKIDFNNCCSADLNALRPY